MCQREDTYAIDDEDGGSPSIPNTPPRLPEPKRAVSVLSPCGSKKTW